jgi:hypothetical protein
MRSLPKYSRLPLVRVMVKGEEVPGWGAEESLPSTTTPPGAAMAKPTAMAKEMRR